jgi:hypothetical protein
MAPRRTSRFVNGHAVVAGCLVIQLLVAAAYLGVFFHDATTGITFALFALVLAGPLVVVALGGLPIVPQGRVPRAGAEPFVRNPRQLRPREVAGLLVLQLLILAHWADGAPSHAETMGTSLSRHFVTIGMLQEEHLRRTGVYASTAELAGALPTDFPEVDIAPSARGGGWAAALTVEDGDRRFGCVMYTGRAARLPPTPAWLEPLAPDIAVCDTDEEIARSRLQHLPGPLAGALAHYHARLCDAAGLFGRLRFPKVYM